MHPDWVDLTNDLHNAEAGREKTRFRELRRSHEEEEELPAPCLPIRLECSFVANIANMRLGKVGSTKAGWKMEQHCTTSYPEDDDWSNLHVGWGWGSL